MRSKKQRRMIRIVIFSIHFAAFSLNNFSDLRTTAHFKGTRGKKISKENG